MSVIFITGGNKGLGFETARRLIDLGHKVYIGCRDKNRGELAAKKLGASMIVIDVTDTASVRKAAETLEEKERHIDILINNAGVSGINKKPADITAEDIKKVFETNVFGIVFY